MAFNPERELQDFPCSFNLETGNKVSHQRLKHVRDNVMRDLEAEDCPPEERIRHLNLLSWALFRLNDKKLAQEINTEVLGLTNRLNVTALGNLIFISCGLGNKINGRKYFTELHNLEENNSNYETLKCAALGEQAYSYSRLGGVENYKLCISLFKKCIKKCPDNYLWKYGLGLVDRRLTNYNLHCSSPEKMDVYEITKECADVLFEVAENAKENRLRGLAYAQLVQLRQYNGRHNKLFKSKDIMTLLDLALQYGDDNPSVLTMCGKSIKAINIDLAVDLLRYSLKLRENAITYHHIGISLLKKVDLITSKRYSSKPKFVRQLTFSGVCNTDTGNHSDCQADGAKAQTENLDSGFFSNSFSKETSRGYETVKGIDSSHAKDLLSEQFQNKLQLNEKPYVRYTQKDFSSGASNFYKKSAGRNKSEFLRQRDVDLHTTKKKPLLQHTSLEENSSYSLSSMAQFAKSPTKKLDKDNDLVKEAMQNFEKAIVVSMEENVPARLSLGDLYMRTDQFQEALEQYNLIFERQSEDYLVTIITANESAGKCLLQLSETAEDGDKEFLKMEAKEKFKKALSLAADLAIRNPLYANCEVKVWEAFRSLKSDVDKINSQQQRYKETITLLELAKNKDIANVITEMLEQGLELDDIKLFEKGLKCFLREGKFEDALTFLNIACTKSCLTKDDAWATSEILVLRATTYISTSWERLTKSSPDSRRVFQQMFQLRYGHCEGMVSGEDEEPSEIKKSDVLIINDESADSEEQPGVTTALARNLSRVFKGIFGLDTAINLERNVDYGRSQGEIQLEEMEKYSLVVLILGEQDTESYKRMLEATHLTKGPNIVVIFTCRKENCPKILSRNNSVDMTDEDWHKTKLLDPPPTHDWSTSEVIDRRSMLASLKTFFDNQLHAVLRLFCLLVHEDFERHRAVFENPAQMFCN